MSSGYVLNFSDRTFAEFFQEAMQTDIADERFAYGGSKSKANRMRGFWKEADDAKVGKCIKALLAYIEDQFLLGKMEKASFKNSLLLHSQRIADRLLEATSSNVAISEHEFIAREFSNLSLEMLELDPAISALIQQRMTEIEKCLKANAPLAVVFLCGSTLEGILLGIALGNPKDFNQSSLSPKNQAEGAKHLKEWSLNELINVARNLSLIGEDVKKFSHALRDFRNYIHPSEQLSSGFEPDRHTAQICWQVLRAAISQLSER